MLLAVGWTSLLWLIPTEFPKCIEVKTDNIIADNIINLVGCFGATSDAILKIAFVDLR